MDRHIVWPGQIPLDTDQLHVSKSAMLGIGKLAEAMFGVGGVVQGLGVSPSTPANMTVNVAPGAIYQQANVDNTAFGSLPSDTADSIVKQGIQLGTLSLPCPAPTTSGQSINYLIEATMTEVDTDSAVLPFYNASNPQQPFSGPGGNGLPSATTRACRVGINAKPGVSATTGSQVTPAVDPGYIALAVVTVAFGQTTITASNIATISSDITAPQFDSSKRMATTEFVNGSGMHFPSGTVANISGDAIVPVSAANGLIGCGAGAVQTLTLPPAGLFPIGTTYTFINTSNTFGAIVTVSSGGVLSNAPNNSIGVFQGETLTVVAASSNVWWVINGAASLKNTTRFAAQLGTTQGTAGYQRLPSGIIIQWGQVTTDSSGKATFTFPIAFPNSPTLGIACYGNPGPASLFTNIGALTTTTGLAYATTPQGVGQPSAGMQFIIIGH